MKHGGKWLVCVIGGLTLGTAGAVTPDTPDSPYQEIVSRNVFSLKPPPPPPNPEDTKPPPSKITLTGITTIVGKKALMKTPAPPVKPGTPPGTPPPTEQFYMLGEGQRDGEIEVLAIDEKAGSVKVRNSGVEVTLTFEKDGVKPPVSAPPAIPGAPISPMPGGVIPPPSLPPVPNPAVPGIKPTFPVRPMRSPGQADVGGAGIPNYAAGGVQPVSVALPGFNSAVPAQSAQIPQNTMTLEEQVIGIEAQRKLTENQVLAGRLPPLPPTVLTPPGAPGSVVAPAQETQAQTPAQRPPVARPGFPGLPPLPGQ